MAQPMKRACACSSSDATHSRRRGRALRRLKRYAQPHRSPRRLSSPMRLALIDPQPYPIAA